MEVDKFTDISGLPERNVYGPERNRNESLLFFRSVLWQQLLTIFPEKVKEDDGILKRQSLSTVRVYSHSYQKLFIFSYEKVKLFGKCVEYYNLVLNETCNDNRLLRKQRRLFSRKCTVKISWDDGKQCLDESFKLTVFDKFIANGSVSWSSSVAYNNIVLNA